MNDLILITGINGFIGQHVAKQLLENGNRLLGVSIEPKCKMIHENVIYEQADISNAELMESLFSKYKIKTVIHLAAIVHKNTNDLSWDSYYRVNYQASEKIFELANKYGVQEVLFASTIEVYGTTSVQLVSESTERNPETDYGKTKKMAEDSLLALQNPGFRYAIMRFAPVYSNEFRLNLNKRIYIRYPKIAYIFRDGGYSFHFCSVHNIGDFVVEWLKNGQTGVYHICDAKPFTASELIQLEKSSGKAGIVIKMPYALCYSAIWCLERVMKLLRKKDSFFSTYNFKKMFYSVRWEKTSKDPKWSIINTFTQK